MNVAELRRILADLPDDMPVMIPGPSGDGLYQPAAANWFMHMQPHPSGRGHQSTTDANAPGAVFTLVIWRK